MSVVFIMLDGLRPDAINEQNTPNLVQFIQRGAYTLQGRSVMPSITLPCHTSIFHSVPPNRHGILDNSWHSMARPVTGLVEHLKAHDKSSGFIYNWEQLRDLNRPGNLQLSFFTDSAYLLDGDDIIAEMAVKHHHQTDFMFVYFGTIDTCGHAFEWMSKEYLQQANHVDGLVKQVLDVMEDGETTIIIQADHGGNERNHGTDSPEDMTIPWMIAGPNIKQNHRIERAVTLLDTAPTIAHAFGIEPHNHWEGDIVHEAFNGTGN